MVEQSRGRGGGVGVILGMKREIGWGRVGSRMDEWMGGEQKERGVGCGVSLTFE